MQIRGSLPFIWQQDPDLKCVPRVKMLKDKQKNKEVFEKHINSLHSIYGLIIVLNLIDGKRVQKKIGDFFENIVKSSSQVNKIKISKIYNSLLKEEKFRYYWFDLNKECHRVKMKIENLDKMIRELEKFFSEQNRNIFFELEISDETVNFL